MKFPRSSGVLLHPTSLPGPHGSGDFGPAAYHFVDWLVTAGQALWQILPLGGTGPGNSPYMSSSAFAGNLLLIDLGELAQHGWLDAEDLIPEESFADARVNFPAVVPYRMERLARATRRFFASSASPSTSSSAAAATAAERADFADFQTRESDWLDDYALFMALSEHYEARKVYQWHEWDAALARREPEALEAAAAEHSGRIDFWRFCQWCFFRQWAALRRYANERGVQIVGDLPIFIAHQSAEVWARQELFELGYDGRPTVVAGVPPDRFSATGQRWGNPLYRWTVHAAEGFAWWIERVRRVFELVDIVRIDHFRGFAAYWEIPADEPTAIDGHWIEAPGDALFDAIESELGPMPIIAEDLGVITPDVVALRRKFALPGMRILQFAFGGDSGNAYLPHNYAPDSVVYPGTHDNDTTIGWWASASEAERDHARAYLATEGAEIHWDLIRAACASVADTAIYPLQDVLGLSGEHRMNLPGKGEGFWEWRFSWDQFEPGHARRLHGLCELFGRHRLQR